MFLRVKLATFVIVLILIHYLTVELDTTAISQLSIVLVSNIEFSYLQNYFLLASVLLAIVYKWFCVHVSDGQLLN